MKEGINSSSWKVFFYLLVFYAIYAAVYIFQSSFVIEGIRCFSLFDDAMISMRYAKNLAEGFGPVWNPASQPVEGYTNPLWMIYMTIPHLLGISAFKTSLFIQVSSGVFFIIHLFFLKRITDMLSGGSNAVMIIAVLLNILYQPLLTWTLLGMETALLLPLISAALWLSIKNFKTGIFSCLQIILPGTAILVRLDSALLFAAFAIFAVIINKNKTKIIFLSLFVLFFAVAPLTLFRFFFYGDLLPNTYYLKMTGFPPILRISRGAFSALKFIVYMNPGVFLLPFLYVIYKKDKLFILISILFLLQIAYSVYSGGDAWEFRGGANRFISVTVPFFFILLSLAVRSGVNKIFKSLKTDYTTPKFYKAAVYVIFFLLSATALNTMKNREDLASVLLLKQPFTKEFNKAQFKTGMLMKKYLKPCASYATPIAGGAPYISGLKVIDLLGKNDNRIAKMQVQPPKGLVKFYSFNPGHNKWNYDYSIGKLKPDAVAALWKDKETAMKYLEKYYVKKQLEGFDFYFRKNSEKVRWDKFD